MSSRKILIFHILTVLSINLLSIWLLQISGNIWSPFLVSSLLVVTSSIIIYHAWPELESHKNNETLPQLKIVPGAKEADLFDVAEDLIFISQQLVWLVNQNRTSLKKLAQLSQGIARECEINASGAQETAAGIAEFASASSSVSKVSKKALLQCQESSEMTQNKQEQIIDSNETILKSAQIIKEIADSMYDIESTVNELYQLSAEQQHTSEQMAEAVEMITMATVEIAGNTQEALNRVSLQEEGIGEIYAQAKQVTAMADRLHKLASLSKTEKEIIFGINPFLAPRFIREHYVPILEAVAYAVNLKPHFIIVSEYDSLGRALLKGTVDVGWFSPFAYISAKMKGDIIPLVTPVVNNYSHYTGYIITLKDQGIQSINDLKGKRFGFVDSQSASGYIFPKALLAEENKSPEDFFNETVFLGSHNRVIDGVFDGTVDAGATYSEAMESAKARGLPIEKIAIIAQSEPIPKDAIAARPNLNPELIHKIQQAFLAITDKDVRYSTFMKKTAINGFIAATDASYNPLRKLAQITDDQNLIE